MTRQWFIDENGLLLGRRLAQTREGVVYPGHEALPEVERGAKDDAWLAEIGRLGLIVITRDQRIRYRPVERKQWIAHRVRGFILTGAGNLGTREQLALIDASWPRMVALVDEHEVGPWMASVTKSGVRFLIEPPA